MMNAKKKIETKWIVSLGMAMLVGLASQVMLYGMEVEPSKQPNLSEVYFSPQDQDAIMNRLSALLDDAKQQVLVAMYWITDQSLIEKIGAAKKRGVDVQIVVDESISDFFDLNSVINPLMQNNIVPVIYPSNHNDAAGKMHNKFVVVDGTIVFTGSANFTKKALDSSAWGFNFENVIVINSVDIAKKFVDNFDYIKKKIFDFYVEIIATNDLSKLPEWIHYLFPLVYKDQLSLQQFAQEIIVKYKPEEQKTINRFFDIQPKPATEQQLKALKQKSFSKEALLDLSYPEAIYLLRNSMRPAPQREPATEQQQRRLKQEGFSDEKISGISTQEASDLINGLERQNKFLGKRTPKKWEPATEPQQRLLRNMGVSDREMSSLSKQDASDLIGKIKQEGWDPATEPQLRLLRNMGFSFEEISDLSKQEASDLINDTKEEQENSRQYNWYSTLH